MIRGALENGVSDKIEKLRFFFIRKCSTWQREYRGIVFERNLNALSKQSLITLEGVRTLPLQRGYTSASRR